MSLSHTSITRLVSNYCNLVVISHPTCSAFKSYWNRFHYMHYRLLDIVIYHVCPPQILLWSLHQFVILLDRTNQYIPLPSVQLGILHHERLWTFLWIFGTCYQATCRGHLQDSWFGVDVQEFLVQKSCTTKKKSSILGKAQIVTEIWKLIHSKFFVFSSQGALEPLIMKSIQAFSHYDAPRLLGFGIYDPLTYTLNKRSVEVSHMGIKGGSSLSD